MNRYLRIALPLALLGALAFILDHTSLIRSMTHRGHESIYVVMKATESDMEFWQVVEAGMQAAATEYDIAPKIVGPQLEKDVDEQIQILGEVIKKRPDGILLVAGDYNRLVPLVKKAAAEGIVVVTLDSGLNSDVPVSFVGTDSVAAGFKAGEEIVRLVPPGKEIAIISHIRGNATAIEREKGVREALKEHGRPAPIGTFFVENDLTKAYRIVTEILATHPNLGGIVALNENSTVGTGRALRDAGAADRVKLVGFDNSKEEAQFLESGVVQALMVQKPFNMGYIGIRTLVAALRRQKVPKVLHTASVLVRKSDMFTPENQKLLFPILQNN